MPKKVVLIDYGVGNLLSVRRALEVVGGEVIQTGDASKIAEAEFLVLPGVGAFGHCMMELKRHELTDVICKYSKSGKRLLSICVGMQMLLDYGEEFGRHEGLGLIAGSVEKISDTGVGGEKHKIPHIAWNSIISREGFDWQNSPLKNTAQESYFYFTHSYAVRPDNDNSVLAETFYNGRKIAAAINVDNTFGFQFHPERSGPVGLSVLKQFLGL